jgi:hypothetical protein
MVHRTGPGLDFDIRFHHDCGLYVFETESDALAHASSNLELLLSDGETSIRVNVIDVASQRRFELMPAPTLAAGSHLTLQWLPSTDRVMRPAVVTVESLSPKRCQSKPIGWNDVALDADGTMTIAWPPDMSGCVEDSLQLVFSDTSVQPAHTCDGVARCRVEIADVRIPPVEISTSD